MIVQDNFRCHGLKVLRCGGSTGIRFSHAHIDFCDLFKVRNYKVEALGDDPGLALNLIEDHSTFSHSDHCERRECPQKKERDGDDNKWPHLFQSGHFAHRVEVFV
jgi:hypothetical protein